QEDSCALPCKNAAMEKVREAIQLLQCYTENDEPRGMVERMVSRVVILLLLARLVKCTFLNVPGCSHCPSHLEAVSLGGGANPRNDAQGAHPPAAQRVSQPGAEQHRPAPDDSPYSSVLAMARRHRRNLCGQTFAQTDKLQ